MKKISKVSLVLMIIIAAQAATVSANQPLLEVKTHDIYLTAGNVNTFTVELDNTGNSDVFDVEALLTSTSPGIKVLNEAHKVVNRIEGDKSIKYTPTVYVDDAASLGAYTLNLNVIYRRFGAGQDSVVNVPVTVVVNRGYVPYITYTGSVDNKVTAGEESQVSFSFHNSHTEALTDLEFTLSSGVSTVAVIDGNSLNVESLSPGEAVNIDATLSVLKGTALGAYNLVATASFTMEEDSLYQSFNLPVVVDSQKPDKSTVVTLREVTYSDVVNPGREFTMTLDVTCNGAQAYETMSKLGVVGGSLSPLSPTTLDLGDLNPGQTVEATYRLLATGAISAGQYPVTVALSYTNSQGKPAQVTETLTVMVEPIVDFQLLDTPDAAAPRGEAYELESDLLLIGTDSVEFVRIEVVPDDKFTAISGSEEYIGAVDPDSPIPFDLDFKVSEETQTGTHPLKLQVTYRDHLNREHTVELTQLVKVTEAQQKENPSNGGGLLNWLRNLFGR